MYVYRLISSGCIEENMYLRQIDKQSLNKECIEDEDSRRYFIGNKNSKKKESELYGIGNIFKLTIDESDSLTKQILHVIDLNKRFFFLKNIFISSYLSIY